ncbi:acyl-CoA--sterol O-acyltransferase 1-like [Lotus japonicus]|uniref:acyl-CoA--sterol O-acyltransferase 1-like n=1 Tax=Lotus japonicus TaxID=34305 RepID=UPI002582928E|nr:acyl-CoA--sterol O-acyltransferase 1-like [Lotus japonicus]
MEGEINNLLMVWTLAAATLCYCHTIGHLIPPGKPRLLALSPAILLLLLLPLNLTSVHLGGPTSFFLGWLSTFKLLLFAFNKGPLTSHPPLSLLHFVSLASLPIKFQSQHQKPPQKITKNRQNSLISYIFIPLIVVTAYLIPLFGKNQNLHPKFVLFLYSLHMYIGLEFFFALASSFTQKLLNVELEPQFDKPYLSTSLQNFWGKRWNIAVNRVLHPTVYEPVVTATSTVIGRRWAPIPGVFATFAVSALMHELIFYYLKREERRTWDAWEPSWDAMCFFAVHGVCLGVEIGVKKVVGGRWRMPTGVAWVLTVGFVYSTALWLFLPALVRCRLYEKATREVTALGGFVKGVYDAFKFVVRR